VASSRDQRSGKTHRRARAAAKPTRGPSEKAKREIRKLEQDRGISAEMAARLQAQWGNQAVAQLLDLPASGELAATAAERRELGEDEEELLDQIGEEVEGPGVEQERGAGLGATTQRGLPAMTASAGPARDQQYGGDDEDEDPLPLPDEPEGTALRFDRSGRGNLAKLQQHREQGRLPQDRLDAARSELERGSRELAARAGHPQPLGDSQFQAPMDAWEDASLVAGRGCSIEERQDLAGPYDALGRPMAVGAFVQRRATTPLGRSISRLCAAAPGTLTPGAGGLAGASARIGALAVLGMAADGLHHGSLRDRATRTALSQAALELTLMSAGDTAESVPPAHTLYRRITKQRPRGDAPTQPPGPTARHWMVPALREVGQLASFPVVRRWSPPPPLPVVDLDDPVSVVDAALRSDGMDGAERVADLSPLLSSIDALLAAGGRAQVELCTAALASRRAAFDGTIAAALRDAYRRFRAAALELLRAREVLDRAHLQPLGSFEDHLLRSNDELDGLRRRMIEAREDCISTLAHIGELG